MGAPALEATTELPGILSTPGPDKAIPTHGVNLDPETGPGNETNTQNNFKYICGAICVTLPMANEWVFRSHLQQYLLTIVGRKEKQEIK